MNFVKLLFNPIFLLAVGMHAGLLLIPVAGGSSDDIVPAPDPEGESITVTRIPPQPKTPPKPAAGQAAPKPNRPATTAPPTGTTARSATASKPATRGANQPQRTQGSSTSRGSQGQSSASRPSANGNNRSNTTARGSSSNNQSSQPAPNTPNASPGLPNLPEDSNNAPSSVPVETVPSKPDLVALREGAQSQDVPNLLQQFLARLHHSVLSTTEPEVEEAKRTWLAALEQQPGLQVSSPEALEKSLTLNYPLTVEAASPRRLRSCLNPLPVSGMVGVVLAANGEMATEPTLLRSSGYGFLNDIALEKIKDYSDFPEDSGQKIYTVDVEVDYDKDACVDLTKLKTN